MGILLGAIAAVMFGASDVLAATGSRTNKPISVTRTALLVSIAITPLFLLLKPFDLAATDVAYAALSGVAIGTALLVIYVGYTRAPIGVIAPIASVLTAGVPVFVALVRGDGLSLVAGVGVVVGVGAVALCSYQPSGSTTNMRVAFVAGTTAGICFGISFALLALTRDGAGLAPVPIQRVSGLVFLTLVHPLVRAPWLARQAPGRRLAIVTGITAAVGMGVLQLAYRNGDSGPVSVAASQFAAAAVLIYALVNHERLRWWQGSGLALASVGVGLMALG